MLPNPHSEHWNQGQLFHISSTLTYYFEAAPGSLGEAGLFLMLFSLRTKTYGNIRCCNRTFPLRVFIPPLRSAP